MIPVFCYGAALSFCAPLQGLVVFDIDSEEWTLDLRSGSGAVYKGMPKEEEKPDLTLTISDDNFAKLVAGKLGPQQVLSISLSA